MEMIILNLINNCDEEIAMQLIYFLLLIKALDNKNSNVRLITKFTNYLKSKIVFKKIKVKNGKSGSINKINKLNKNTPPKQYEPKNKLNFKLPIKILKTLLSNIIKFIPTVLRINKDKFKYNNIKAEVITNTVITKEVIIEKVKEINTMCSKTKLTLNGGDNYKNVNNINVKQNIDNITDIDSDNEQINCKIGIVVNNIYTNSTKRLNNIESKKHVCNSNNKTTDVLKEHSIDNIEKVDTNKCFVDNNKIVTATEDIENMQINSIDIDRTSAIGWKKYALLHKQHKDYIIY